MAEAPGLRYRVRANRAFLGRATRYLAAEAGLRQFLDIGTGIPAAATPTRWRSESLRMPAWSTCFRCLFLDTVERRCPERDTLVKIGTVNDELTDSAAMRRQPFPSVM